MRNVIDAGWAVMDVEGCPCDEDFPRRTEKTCGPDIRGGGVKFAGLAAAGDGGQKARAPGRPRDNP